MNLLAALFLACQGDPAYETRTLETGGRADRLVSRDLNGDSFPDLVVQNGIDLHVFLFDKAKGLCPASPKPLRLDRRVFLWCLAVLEKGMPPALLTAGSRGIQAHAFDGRSFADPGIDLVVHPSLFEGASAESRAPLHLDFAPDLDLDGAPEILLFRPEGLFIMKPHAPGDWRCRQKLPLPVETALLVNWLPNQKVTETAVVPLLAHGDVDGDGRPDLSYYRDEAIGCFRLGPDGRYLPPVSLDLTAEKTKRRDRFLKFEVPPRAQDFNGDGLLDLALVYPTKGRVQVYYGAPGRRDFTVPDRPMKVADGWSTGIYIEDLDGDGRQDLVMGVVRKFGIMEGMQVFISGRVDLELHIYPTVRENSAWRFPRDPVQELKFSIPFAFHVTRTSATVDLVFRPNFKADLNKDGLRDLLVSADEKTLNVHHGVKGGGFAREPGAKIVMNPPEGVQLTEPFVEDFNRDGISDLVLKHVVAEKNLHVLELKLSKP